MLLRWIWNCNPPRITNKKFQRTTSSSRTLAVSTMDLSSQSIFRTSTHCRTKHCSKLPKFCSLLIFVEMLQKSLCHYTQIWPIKEIWRIMLTIILNQLSMAIVCTTHSRCNSNSSTRLTSVVSLWSQWVVEQPTTANRWFRRRTIKTWANNNSSKYSRYLQILFQEHTSIQTSSSIIKRPKARLASSELANKVPSIIQPTEAAWARLCKVIMHKTGWTITWSEWWTHRVNSTLRTRSSWSRSQTTTIRPW